MSFNGIYTISYNHAGYSLNVTYDPQSTTIQLKDALKDANKTNLSQNWYIRPIHNLGDNVFTIQNLSTGAYLYPQGTSEGFRYQFNPFVWSIVNRQIRTVQTSSLGWVASNDSKRVELTHGTATTWKIQATVGQGV